MSLTVLATVCAIVVVGGYLFPRVIVWAGVTGLVTYASCVACAVTDTHIMIMAGLVVGLFTSPLLLMHRAGRRVSDTCH